MNFFKRTFIFIFLSCSLSSFAADWDESLLKAIKENDVEEVKRCLPHINDVGIFVSVIANIVDKHRLTIKEEADILQALEMSIYNLDLMSLEDIFNEIGIRETEASKALIILDLLLKASRKSTCGRERGSILRMALLDLINQHNEFLFRYMLMCEASILDRYNTFVNFLITKPENFNLLEIFFNTYIRGNKFQKNYEITHILETFFSYYFRQPGNLSEQHYEKILNHILDILERTHINDRNFISSPPTFHIDDIFRTLNESDFVIHRSIIDIAIEQLRIILISNMPEVTPNTGSILLTLEEHGADLEEAIQRIPDIENQAMIRMFINMERDRRNAAGAREVEDMFFEDAEQVEPDTSWTTYFLNLARASILAPFFFFHNQNS